MDLYYCELGQTLRFFCCVEFIFCLRTKVFYCPLEVQIMCHRIMFSSTQINMQLSWSLFGAGPTRNTGHLELTCKNLSLSRKSLMYPPRGLRLGYDFFIHIPGIRPFRMLVTTSSNSADITTKPCGQDRKICKGLAHTVKTPKQNKLLEAKIF